MIFHALLDDSMGADDHLGFAGGHLGQGFPFFFRLQAARQEDDLDASGSKYLPEGLKMLICQHLRGGHDGGLIAVLDGPIGGGHGNRRFAAAHVPLDQAVHDFPGGHVCFDFFQHSLLGTRQGKGQESFRLLQGFFLFQDDARTAVLQGIFQAEKGRLEKE